MVGWITRSFTVYTETVPLHLVSAKADTRRFATQRRTLVRAHVLLTTAVLLCLAAGLAAAQDQATPTDKGWPKTISASGATILLYQPQIDSWDGNRITAYAAIAVTADPDGPQTYGVVHFTARTEVDKVNREVALDDYQVTGLDLPTAQTDADRYQDILQQAWAHRVHTIALDRLEADLAAMHGGGAQEVPVQNEPPRVIFSTVPSVLILIDGQPVLRPVEGDGRLRRVINTPALILFDPNVGGYCLSILGGWVTGPTVAGPWSYLPDPPAELNRVRDALAAKSQVDLLTGTETDSGTPAETLAPDNVPNIFFSMVPAELVQTDGPPQLTPIPGTRLLYVSNTGSDLFLNTADQSYYLLITGRWFRAPALDAPWTYVSGRDLPADFARIPQDSPKANVLVSVPGTPAAQEAVIEDQVPQTATINRGDARPNITYDGDPNFAPIENTPLQYAANCHAPVIEVTPDSYYAVYNGVWFTAGSPVGPWAVATYVPQVIYSIPPSCPVYYATYVRVYGCTQDVVYCGYTPGYYGAFVGRDGTVVYGTGWRYRPHIHTTWIGRPWTYGCGAGFSWSSAGGWSFDLGIGYRVATLRPWCGPLHHGWMPRPGWHPSVGHHAWGGFAAVNTYGRWGQQAAVQTDAGWAHIRPIRRNPQPPVLHLDPRAGIVVLPPRGDRNPIARPAPPTPGSGTVTIRPIEREPQVVGTNQGQVYRIQPGGGWQQHVQNGWRPAPPTAPTGQLNRIEQGRIQGEQRVQNFRNGSADFFRPASRPTPPVERPAPSPQRESRSASRESSPASSGNRTSSPDHGKR